MLHRIRLDSWNPDNPFGNGERPPSQLTYLDATALIEADRAYREAMMSRSRLAVEPAGGEVPYALNVDRRRDEIWICGTNSDTLMRFDPSQERFTVYPLPTRVTYTREIDFDAEGRVWTSNSNSPAWQIETGVPRVLRLATGGDL